MVGGSGPTLTHRRIADVLAELPMGAAIPRHLRGAVAPVVAIDPATRVHPVDHTRRRVGGQALGTLGGVVLDLRLPVSQVPELGPGMPAT
eukprot:SAG22_NODE_10704_length_520_cov_0.921615_1_plen_89_part_10